jgi:hypothetical protein
MPGVYLSGGVSCQAITGYRPRKALHDAWELTDERCNKCRQQVYVDVVHMDGITPVIPRSSLISLQMRVM